MRDSRDYPVAAVVDRVEQLRRAIENAERVLAHLATEDNLEAAELRRQIDRDLADARAELEALERHR